MLRSHWRIRGSEIRWRGLACTDGSQDERMAGGGASALEDFPPPAHWYEQPSDQECLPTGGTGLFFRKRSCFRNDEVPPPGARLAVLSDYSRPAGRVHLAISPRRAPRSV